MAEETKRASKLMKRTMELHHSANMKPRRRLWITVLLATVVLAASEIDFVSAGEESTTEQAEMTSPSTTEPGEKQISTYSHNKQQKGI